MQNWWIIARGGDWSALLQVAFALVMLMSYAINQILNRDRKGAPGKPQRTPQRRPTLPEAGARRPPEPGRSAGPPKNDPLLAEIQKFLKQANPEKRGPARTPPAKSLRAEVVKPRVETTISEPLGGPLSGRHLDTGEFGRRASQMTDDLKRSDAEREQHFQQTFTHKIGRLTDTSTSGAAPAAPIAPTPSATDSATAAAAAATGTILPVASWLPLPTTTPEDLRRAIMLNEILQRPEHRW